MSKSVQEAVIEQYCKELRTPRISREYQRFSREAADNGWTYEEFLQRILDAVILQ